MSKADSIGIMDSAYFVSRSRLLAWVNETFQLSVARVEELCTGAVYCRIVATCYPQALNMSKVNWSARLEHEYLKNYKLLQQAFQTLGVQKFVDVGKLTKGKYQDNLEFLQWIKRFYDLSQDHPPQPPQRPVLTQVQERDFYLEKLLQIESILNSTATPSDTKLSLVWDVLVAAPGEKLDLRQDLQLS